MIRYGDAPYSRSAGFAGDAASAAAGGGSSLWSDLFDSASDALGSSGGSGGSQVNWGSILSNGSGSGSGTGSSGSGQNIDFNQVAAVLKKSAAFVTGLFKKGGEKRKKADTRAGVRDGDGWGAQVEIPGNLVAPFGKDRYIEFGEWGKHTGSDGNPYVGFQTWLLDSKGNRLTRLDLGTRYAKVNPDGSILTQGNFAPADKDAMAGVFTLTPTADGMGRNVKAEGRWGIDPPTAYTPFEGFALKSDLIAALNGTSPPAGGNTNNNNNPPKTDEESNTTIWWVVGIAAVIIAIILFIKLR